MLQVFDHMALLQSWIGEQAAKGRALGELYERVQWAGNVLPRLCVGGMHRHEHLHNPSR